jgi:ATP-binding protein involved in chromosome partitioning
MSTSTDEIRRALGAVKDPATGRGIVASGQLTDVAIRNESVILSVGLISPGYPNRAELERAIRQALAGLGLEDIVLEFGLAVPRKPPRQDLDRLPTVKSVIAVAAGKGGVGKSTLAVNLALALDRLGAGAGVLDADVFGPSVPKLMGEPDRAPVAAVDGSGISPAYYGSVPVASVEYFIESGRAVMWRGPMIHSLLTQFVENVQWGELDYLVVDLPPGTGDAQLSLAQLIPITGAVLLTTPQDVAVLDVRKAADMFKHTEIPILGVVENMSHYLCPSCGHREAIFTAGGGRRLADELAVELLGEIPIDPAISRSGEAGRPLVAVEAEGGPARAFFDIAVRVALEASKLSATGPRRSAALRTV